jgi:hypothetical protein
MMKSISPPNAGFIVVVDFEGDPVDTYSHNSVLDEVMRRCEILDRNFPGGAPHSAWRWENGEFSRVLG